jgi:glucan phosphorylase
MIPKEIRPNYIAYYSMEVGLDSALPTYSGGLGVLAGDTLRAAADFGLPMIGITLLHRKGYFRQTLDASGNQTESPASWNYEEVLEPMVPRAFVKTGAEGVFCSAVPHAGLGIALKCDDGANRASEVLMAAILAGLPVWSELEYDALRFFSHADLWNWRKLRVGEIRVVDMELQGKGARAPESIT